TIVTLGTVGFGDIEAAGQAARIAVMIQIVFDLIVIGTLLAVMSTSIARRVEAGRRAADGNSAGGDDSSHGATGGRIEEDGREGSGESRSAVVAVPADEGVGGGGVLGFGVLGGGQQRGEREGLLFAQLHAPLVETVDAPDGSLHEDLVLVEGDELADH